MSALSGRKPGMGAVLVSSTALSPSIFSAGRFSYPYGYSSLYNYGYPYYNYNNYNYDTQPSQACAASSLPVTPDQAMLLSKGAPITVQGKNDCGQSIQVILQPVGRALAGLGGGAPRAASPRSMWSPRA